MANYKVTITDPVTFPADQRVRSGVTVFKDVGYEGELTAEQLTAIQADSYLMVEEVTEAKSTKKQKPAKS